VAIAGHRDSFFRPLRHVRVGDDVFVDTPQGHLQYRVTSLQVVKPQDLSVLDPTDTATLTLITCYPFDLIGSAPDRLVVRATRVGEPAAARAVALGPSPDPIPAAVQEPAPAESTVAHVRAAVEAVDDETLVRQTIERFRLTYNARLVSHNDVRSDGPLRFEGCIVAVAGDYATARCTTSAESPEGSDAPAWTSMLSRGRDGWMIRSIVTN
jgi:hypothetical protein